MAIFVSIWKNLFFYHHLHQKCSPPSTEIHRQLDFGDHDLQIDFHSLVHAFFLQETTNDLQIHHDYSG